VLEKNTRQRDCLSSVSLLSAQGMMTLVKLKRIVRLAGGCMVAGADLCNEKYCWVVVGLF
jgi:hypothetical protein